MDDEKQKRLEKLFLQNIIEFVNKNADEFEFELDNIISLITDNTILVELNKIKKEKELEQVKYTYTYTNTNTNNSSSRLEKVKEKNNVNTIKLNPDIIETEDGWVLPNYKIFKSEYVIKNGIEDVSHCLHDILDLTTGRKSTFCGDQIWYLLKKNNISIEYFEGCNKKNKYEKFRKCYHPTPEDIEEKKIQDEIDEIDRKELDDYLEQRNKYISKKKASSRLEKLKEKNNIKKDT